MALRGYQGFESKDELWGEILVVFFHTIVNGSFCRMDDQAMHDEWHEGSGSTNSAGGRGNNPNSASAPNILYRGQRAAFPPEFLLHNNLEVATLRELVDVVGVEEEVDRNKG